MSQAVAEAITPTFSHSAGGRSPCSVHPDDVQVAEVHTLLVKPGVAGATSKTQVGASALGCRCWLLQGGGCLALPCTQEGERGGEEVRTPGLPGIEDPQGSSACTIRKLALLVLRNHWLAWGSPSHPRRACAPQWQLLLRAPCPVAPALGSTMPLEETPGQQQVREGSSPSCRAKSRARAMEHQAVSVETIAAAAECLAGPREQGAPVASVLLAKPSWKLIAEVP